LHKLTVARIYQTYFPEQIHCPLLTHRDEVGKLENYYTVI